MDEKLREKALLDNEEIRASHPYWEELSDNAVLRVKVIAKAQLDKAEPLIRKDERERAICIIRDYFALDGTEFLAKYPTDEEAYWEGKYGEGIILALKATKGKEG